ncbi:MAG TPA: DNA-3-methyladenine glycosylase I [Anaerovoracaceae bacterium]|nr:DNA-3-methyladenine glycosylase I [Anaerovoracaceae bacterium]
MRACSWPGKNQIMQAYHDDEWCVPSYDDQYLFEMLALEGAQSGLSWSIVLSKREGYKKAFHDFDVSYCSELSDEGLEHIRTEYNVIRNISKLKSVRANARSILKIQEEYGSFSDFLWRYADSKPIVNHWEKETDAPAQTAISEQISKDLKKRGFQYVGPVTVYSFMQAMGMVDDHIITCPFHTENR